jgi:predicted nucleic acid-binding protein
VNIASLAGHERVGLDSNVLIYLLDGTGTRAERAEQLVDALEAGAAQGVMSTLVLAEICSGPARAGLPGLVERYADELHSIQNVSIVSLSAEIAVDAAALRGRSSLALIDAIHLATARDAGATAFVTNDRRIKPINRLEILYLDELR